MSTVITIAVKCKSDKAVHVCLQDATEIFDDFRLTDGQRIDVAVTKGVAVTLREGALDGLAISG